MNSELNHEIKIEKFEVIKQEEQVKYLDNEVINVKKNEQEETTEAKDDKLNEFYSEVKENLKKNSLFLQNKIVTCFRCIM